LEQSNAKWQQYIHDPELHPAFIEAIEWIGDEDEHEVDMKREDCGADGFEVSNAYSVGFADQEESSQTSENDSCVYGRETDKETAQTVKNRMIGVVVTVSTPKAIADCVVVHGRDNH
jgi:hypothetical protein